MLTRCGELSRTAVLRPFPIRELQRRPGSDLDRAMKKLYELQAQTFQRRRGDLEQMIKELVAARCAQGEGGRRSQRDQVCTGLTAHLANVHKSQNAVRRIPALS